MTWQRVVLLTLASVLSFAGFAVGFRTAFSRIGWYADIRTGEVRWTLELWDASHYMWATFGAACLIVCLAVSRSCSFSRSPV